MQKKRLLPLAGIVYVGLFIAAMVLNNSSPDGNASGGELLTYYDDHATRENIAAVLLIASTPFLVFFGAALATARRPDGPRSAWELVLLAGSVLAAASLQLVGFVHFALANAPGEDLSRDAIRVLAMLDMYIVATAGLGVMMLGAAGTLFSRAGSRRLAWPALVLGIALFVPIADFFAFLLTGVWIIVVGVRLARGSADTSPATRRGAVGVTAALLALALLSSAAAAPAPQASQAPQRYYLALGDSMAYGFQPTKAKPGARPSDFRTGYVDVFAAKLRKLAPGIQVVNYSCPGEATVTFARGRCPTLAEGVRLHDPYRGPQLRAAVAFLRAHQGQVSPITLTLWGAELAPLSEKGRRARAGHHRVRVALLRDPARAPGRSADRRHHRHRRLESRARPHGADHAAVPAGRRRDRAGGEAVACPRRQDVPGAERARLRAGAAGPALLADVLVQGRPAPEGRRLPRHGRCVHGRVRLPAGRVELRRGRAGARVVLRPGPLSRTRTCRGRPLSFLGRGRERDEILRSMLARRRTGCVTLSGPGRHRQDPSRDRGRDRARARLHGGRLLGGLATLRDPLLVIAGDRRHARAPRMAWPTTSGSGSCCCCWTTSSRWSRRRRSSPSLARDLREPSRARHEPRAPARAGGARVRSAAAGRAATRWRSSA